MKSRVIKISDEESERKIMSDSIEMKVGLSQKVIGSQNIFLPVDIEMAFGILLVQ